MEPIPDYGDLMTCEEFKDAVDEGSFVNDDGSGYYATTTEMSRVEARPSDVRKHGFRRDYTHVVWFNK